MHRAWPVHLVAATFVLLPSAGAAQPVPPDASPTEATVFIRVIGTVRAEDPRPWNEKTEARDVELATGSGFVVSPDGYVLTNEHVVTVEEEVTVHRAGQPVRLDVEARTIEVVFPSTGARFAGRVEASDASLDLAVVSIGGRDLPYVHLGDSDALEPGHAVQVIGFPFGRAIEVGRAVTSQTVPQPTASRGSVGALRSGDEGDARYIQTDAAVYPGSSGGPMLDQHGYAIGVVRMLLTRGARSGPAFGIPINVVKGFLAASGLEQVFPTRRATLGPPQSLDWKGLRFRAPDGFDDASRARVRVEWAPPDEVALTVVRVASPLSLPEIEARLVAGREPAAAGAIEVRRTRPQRLGGRAAILGHGRVAAGGAETAYAIIGVGRERVIARYQGPPAHVAFNRSVLDGWLASLEVDPLLTGEVAGPLDVAFEGAVLPHPSAPVVPMPRGWSREPAPLSCDAAPPEASLASSPEGDFTVGLRTAWWPRRDAALEAALAQCVQPRPVSGDDGRPAAAYSLRSTRFGLGFVTEGLLLAVGDALLQLEVDAPGAKQPFVRDVLAQWTAALAAPEAQ